MDDYLPGSSDPVPRPATGDAVAPGSTSPPPPPAHSPPPAAPPPPAEARPHTPAPPPRPAEYPPEAAAFPPGPVQHPPQAAAPPPPNPYGGPQQAFPPQGAYPPPPAPYGAPAGYGYYAQPQRTNGMAIASMVLGIIWIYWIGSILALVFGYIAKKQISESRGTQGGGGMATAGIVLGWVGIGTLTFIIIAGILSSATR
jgi:hypothetical protein